MRFLLILFVFVSSTFAQEKQEEFGETNIIVLEKDTVPFIFRNDFSKSYFYRLQNGTALDYKSTRKIIAMAPDNKTLLESESRWRIFSYVLVGLSITQFSYGIISLCGSDLPYASVNATVFFLYTFPFTILTGQVANTKLQQSVDNYNYYRSYKKQSMD
jgi:hypothetical protein